MGDSVNTGVLLFAYGTLQDKAVQMANFGRELAGRPDWLPGYSTSLIAIRDPAVVATSGKTHHTIAEHTANLSDEVRGTVFEITAEELLAADRYEVSEYTRVLVTLKSGARAWVYVRAWELAPRALRIDQRTFAFKTPAIAAEPAVAAQYAMAGDENSNPVGSASRGGRPHGFGFPDASCDFTVTDERAFGHAQEKFPHPDLKGRAANIQR